jgi:hypothetical protein
MTRATVLCEACQRCGSLMSSIMLLRRDTPPPPQRLGAPHSGRWRLSPLVNGSRLADRADCGALPSDSRKASLSGAAATEPGRAVHLRPRRSHPSARARDSAVLRRRASRFCAHRRQCEFVARCVAQHCGTRRAAARGCYFLGATCRPRPTEATQNRTQSPAVSQSPHRCPTSLLVVVGAAFVIRVAR